MGIYSNISTGSGTTIDIYSPAEQELCCEGFDVNFYEASVVALAESEAVYNKSMKEIGIGELRYFEENGHEIMLYEGVDIKAVFNKIKMFFKKLIDKVKAIFHTFIAKMSSFFGDNKKFVQKYEKEFARKWSDVKEDFEFNGYKFTINYNLSGKDVYDTENYKALKNSIGSKVEKGASLVDAYLDQQKNIGQFINGVKMYSTEDFKNVRQGIIDNKEDINDSIRGDEIAQVKTTLSTNSNYSTDSAMDSKEYSEALFELFRNGESSKEKIEKSEFTGGVAQICTELREFNHTKKAAEKACNDATKSIQKAIDYLDKFMTWDIKQVPSIIKDKGADNDTKNASVEYINQLVSLASEISNLLKVEKESIVQANGAYLQALKDNANQNKAIMVKVISGSKKMQRESYDYTNESYDGSGSFLDSVVLK